MEHSLPILTTLVIGFGFALVFGFLAERFLHAPALVGYLAAGIMAGGYTPGPTADLAIAEQLSELGVILLMFGVGLHFSARDLWKVRTLAVPGAVLQMTAAALLGMAVAALAWDYAPLPAFVFGLCLSCASTVVLLKALEMRGRLHAEDGRAAMGWLVVEDLATVILLVLLPAFADVSQGAASADAASLALLFGKTLLRAAAFMAVMLGVGRVVLPWALWQVARTGSRELFTLFLLTAALGIAYGAAAVFSVSFALGAFFAGMVIRGSRFAERAARETLPLQDAFAVLFFVSAGMLLDWHVFLEEPAAVLLVLLIVIAGKSAAALVLVLSLGRSLRTGLTIAASLAQIGEFSFLLAGQGIALRIFDPSALGFIVAASILSIACNPVLFAAIPATERFLVRRFAWARRAQARERMEKAAAPRAPACAVLAGRGPMLLSAAQRLAASGIAFSAVTDRPEDAEALGSSSRTADLESTDTYREAGLEKAGLVVVAASDPVQVRSILDCARRAAPQARALVPAFHAEEAALLSGDERTHVFSARGAVAAGFAQEALRCASRREDPSSGESGDGRSEESAMLSRLRRRAASLLRRK